jgi:drug/metabolite transporter (DMT)-like permease
LATSPLSYALLRLSEAGAWKYQVGMGLFTLMIAIRKIGTVDLVKTIDPLALTFITALFSLLFALGLRLRLYGVAHQYSLRQISPALVVMGIGTLMGMLGGNVAMQQISPTLHSLMNLALYSFMVAVFAYYFGRGEAVHFKSILPIIAISTVGILIFSRDDLSHMNGGMPWGGILWTLVDICGWAVAIVAITNLVRAGVPVVDVIGLRFVMPVVVLGPYLAATGRLDFGGYWLELILLSLVGYFLPFMISFNVVKKVSVVTFAISLMTTPIVVYAMSLAFLPSTTTLTMLQLLGGLIIFASVGYHLWAEYERTHQRESRLTLRILERIRPE